MPLDASAAGLDALLLGAALQLELSNRDRRVADRRYGILKVHLNRPTSLLAPYLPDGRSLIYAQGSRAIGATIIHGDDDDRFDLDAILEFPTPAGWTPGRVLDTLEQSLKGFPDAVAIKRCTRCIQLQFAFMHLDVTPMDPASEPRFERVGEIYHSPDEGPDSRHPANPYGFAKWFRETVDDPSAMFTASVADARAVMGAQDRISKGMTFFADADIEDLPDDINPIADAPQVIVLKLMKRFLNLRYAKRDRKRPPSVYLSKIAALQPTHDAGLCAQLETYAVRLYQRMDAALKANHDQRPQETNPALPAENFNDRWPQDRTDMSVFRDDLVHLITQLRQARTAEFSQAVQIFGTLFGETVSTSAAKTYLDRLSGDGDSGRYQPGRGFIAAPALALSSAAGAKTSRVPGHRFHPGWLCKK